MLTAALGGLDDRGADGSPEEPTRGRCAPPSGPILRYLLPGDRLELMHLQLRKVLEEEIGEQELPSHRRRCWPGVGAMRIAAGLKTRRTACWTTAPRTTRRPGSAASVYTLVSKPYMTLKHRATTAHAASPTNAALAMELAASETPVRWAELVRAALAGATITSLAAQYPPELLGVMAELGQGPAAFEYASLISDPQGRCEALAAIAGGFLRASDRGSGPGDADCGAPDRRGRRDDFRRHLGSWPTVAGALAQAGQSEAARARPQAAEGITDDFARASALAESPEPWPRPARPRRRARRPRRRTRGIADASGRASALAHVAGALAQAGDFDGCAELAAALPGRFQYGAACRSA